MKIFVHSTSYPASKREIDTYSLSFSLEKFQFYMELHPPHIIYANPQFKPIHFDFAPAGTHVYFSEGLMASDFFAWLVNADQAAKESFNQYID